MEKAELEWRLGGKGGKERLCDLKILDWRKERFSELSTNIKLVKNPGPTIASYNVDDMYVY